MKQWKHDLTRQKKFTSSRFYVRLSAMFGIRIKLRSQVFLFVGNWGKILKTVVLFSVVKSTIFTSGTLARDFYTYDRDEKFIKKQCLMFQMLMMSVNFKKKFHYPPIIV